MKMTIISGSHRKNSQSSKVAKFIRDLLQSQLIDEADIIDLAGNPLPLWDQDVWDNSESWLKQLTPLKSQLQSSDGLIIITPEWHGQVPAGLKNFFLLFGKQELGHKPALIISISSGDGGSYPVAELRMSSYKNNRICYIPEQVIIRNVEQVLNVDEEHNDPRSDSYYRERIAWALGILKEYAKALKGVRELGIINSEQYSNGM
jgi:NAD(P)H-dependent FMN reductase